MKKSVIKYVGMVMAIICVVAIAVGATRAFDARKDRQIAAEIYSEKMAERHTRIDNVLVEDAYGLIRVFEVTENGFGQIVETNYRFVPISNGVSIEGGVC